MSRYAIRVLCFCVLPCVAWADDRPADYAKNWPQWRGPEWTGVAPHADPPAQWSETQSVRWKIKIPGRGHATPVVWGDKVFVLTAAPSDKPVQPKRDPTPPVQAPTRRRRRGPRTVRPDRVLKFMILAVSRRNGAVLWQRTVREEEPHQGAHTTGTWASNSPMTDGKHVYAFFGSRGLHCFDMQGKAQWSKDFGKMNTKMNFGEGSSPALHGDTIVVNWDHEGQSFITALDKSTGREIWRVDRDEITSWSTPLVVVHDGKAQAIVNATGRVRGYDLKTGEVIWECGGMTRNVIPTPVVANGIVHVASGFRGNAMLAIRLSEAKGDITDTKAILWRYNGRQTPYTPSCLLYGDKLYFLRRNDGYLSCFDAGKGTPHFARQKLEGVRGVYASPVGASGRVYIAGRNGMTLVIKHGPKYEVLSSNKLDESFNASPAIAGNEIFLRGETHLYCIARP